MIYYPTTANFIQKTLNAQLLAGATASATLNNVTSIQNKAGIMIIDRVDANGVETPNKVEVVSFAGTSGSTVTTLVRGLGGTTDQDHEVGAIVEFGPDIVWAQGLIDTFNVEHNEDGTHDTDYVVTPTGTQTLTNKTLTSPKVGTAILDANGNEVIKTPATTSAVNEITVTNSATGNAVQVSATGGDTNIDIAVLGKGSGSVKLGNAGLKFPNSDGTADYVLKTDGSGNLSFTPQSASTDGWTSAGETWTYASASTITVPSGAASKYSKGDKIKWTQTTVKYGVITNVADTLLTIAVNTDYTVANAAITDNYYSHQANPVGYPDWFNITAPVFDVSTYDNGSGAQPTTTLCKMKISGKQYFAQYKGNGIKAGTNYYLLITSHSFIASASVDGSLAGTAFIQTSVNNFANILVQLASIETNNVNITDNTTINVLSFNLSYQI